MSKDKIIKEKLNPSTLTYQKVSKGELSGRVNINHLLARVKEQQKKENKITLIYISLFTVIIFGIGIVVSL